MDAMHRKDPMTGCKVLTTLGFFHLEAEKEGKGRSAGDLMGEFFEDFDNEVRKEEARYWEPKYAMDILQELIKEENEYTKKDFGYYMRLLKEGKISKGEVPTAVPTKFKVLRVLEVQHGCSFNSSSTKLIALVKYKGKELLVYASTWRSSGSRWEPPDGETEVVWDYKPEAKDVSHDVLRLCPICGEKIRIAGEIKDGRLVGSCKDAFTIDQWWSK